MGICPHLPGLGLNHLFMITAGGYYWKILYLLEPKLYDILWHLEEKYIPEFLSVELYHEDFCTKNKCMFWILTLSLFLTCTESSFLFEYTHIFKRVYFTYLLQIRNPLAWEGRVWTSHTGSSPSESPQWLKRRAKSRMHLQSLWNPFTGDQKTFGSLNLPKLWLGPELQVLSFSRNKKGFSLSGLFIWLCGNYLLARLTKPFYMPAAPWSAAEQSERGEFFDTR